MMIRAANTLQEARRVAGMAGQADVRPDWSPVAARVRAEATGGWDDSVAVERFQRCGGRLVHGRGVLTGPRTVRVGAESFTARRGIVIATGSQPSIPRIPGLDEVAFWTTHDVIRAERLPDSLLVLGGGPIGCELGQVLARFGVRVTVIEASDLLLPAEDPEASWVVQAAFEAEGIQVRTGAAVQRVRAEGDAIAVTLAGGAELSGSRLLVATGRRVDLTQLGLESAGLGGGRYIEVDERLRAAGGIWAMGDVTGKAIFTHVALYQSEIVSADILGEHHPPVRYDALPRAVFIDPEVWAVGMTEASASAAGLDVNVAVKHLPSTFRGWLHGGGGSGVITLVVDRRTDLQLGATAVGPSGGEVQGMLALAVHARVSLAELRSMIYASPTFHGAVGEAVAASGRGLMTVLDLGYAGFAPAGNRAPNGQ